MASSWVVNELRTMDLKDKRLNRRMIEVLSQLGEHPTASIPAACGGHAEMTAAYRLFDNEKADFDHILQPHIDATRQRISNQSRVLLVQDTTEVDLTRPAQEVVGAGPLDGEARRGALLHTLHAFLPDGTPLGTLHGLPWVREEAVICSSLSRAERAAIPIEDKESYRWVETLRLASEEAQQIPTTRVICIADSEADIYEVLAEGVAEPRRIEWIVRACQNRALQQDPRSESGEKYLREHVLAQPVLFRHTIRVRGRKPKVACETRGRRQPRQSRKAEAEVRAARVTLRPPRRAARPLPELSVNVVLVREVNAPKEDVAVEWLLLTSLAVDTVEQVRCVIQSYCARWMIEVFFQVLKSGCRVEERRFQHIDRLLPCLAVYLIVAWRTLYVCRKGRSCPELNCEAVFEPAEWKSVYKVVRRKDPPKTPPTLGEMVQLVGQLGGYVKRGRGSYPGPKTVWLGLQRMHDFAICWHNFGPDARSGP